MGKLALRKDAVGVEIQTRDGEFFPVIAEVYAANPHWSFSIYAKIGDGRYSKILDAGEIPMPDQLQKIKAKGISLFYLRMEDQKKYLERIREHDPRKAPFHPDKKLALLSHAGRTLQYLNQIGVEVDRLRPVLKWLGHLESLLKKPNIQKIHPLRDLLSHPEEVEHGVSTVIVAILLCRTLQIDQEKALDAVGLAGFFHDVGLYRFSKNLTEEAEPRMTPDQQEIYRLHPALSAEILKEVKDLDPAVVQAVLQHHERKTGKGFPNRVAGTSIHQLAEIVGLSDEFSKLILISRDRPDVDPLREIRLFTLGNFSVQVVHAFRSVFLLSSVKG